MSSIGENIKKRRIAMGMSQVKLAAEIGETKQTLWKYESGTVTNIPLAKVEALAAALSCEPAELLGWEPEKSSAIGTLDEESAPYLTGKETELLEKFRKLNKENRDKVLRKTQKTLDKQMKDKGA